MLCGYDVGLTRPFFLIAGPCVVESHQLQVDVAGELKAICADLEIPFIFKSSYDKANRSSHASYRGPGREEGLRVLADVKHHVEVPVLTDVHVIDEIPTVAAVVDVLQTPAFLCRQTDFIQAVASAGKPVNIKKGQFLAPEDMKQVVAKARDASGTDNILVCERGVSFGYHNLVTDMRALAIMRDTGCPVVFDATHSVQLPGGQGAASGGEREFIPVLARAAVASGIAGLFMETHPAPEKALSDGPNAWHLGLLQGLLEAMVGLDASEQAFIDKTLIELDGSENKSRLGANAILAVSMATARAAAEESGLPLYRYFGGSGAMRMPVPMMNVINGGAHANNNLDLQEFMIVPVGFQSFREALRCGSEIFQQLKSLVSSKGLSTAVGDEGGFAPGLPTHAAAIELIVEAIGKAGYGAGRDVMLALDCAATEFFRDGRYILESEKKNFTSGEFSDYLAGLAERYPIASIEDGMAENDWEGWKILSTRLGRKLQLVGDDLFVTDTRLLREGIRQGVANSILIKVNQIGTLTEAFSAIELAKRAAYGTVISHRSGETEDTTIADIAVGANALQIKTGSLSRSERVAKYNQLLRIEEDLGDSVSYPGREAFPHLR